MKQSNEMLMYVQYIVEPNLVPFQALHFWEASTITSEFKSFTYLTNTNVESAMNGRWKMKNAVYM